MPQHTCVCAFADIFTCFAGELPKELGDLVNLTDLYLDDNEFQGEFVCSVLHAQFGHAHNRVLRVYCTVTEEEKTALKAKLPKIQGFYI